MRLRRSDDRAIPYSSLDASWARRQLGRSYGYGNGNGGAQEYGERHARLAACDRLRDHRDLQGLKRNELERIRL